MEQRVNLVTLGVSNYGRAKAFYEALGWSPALDVQETVFFQANGVILVLWARDRLADDIGLPDDGARWSGIALAHNVRSRGEVHEVIEQARRNGAEITREPAETFYGGYAGAFHDLDGHAWEIAHNPGFGLDDDGNVVLPAGSRTSVRPAAMARSEHHRLGRYAECPPTGAEALVVAECLICEELAGRVEIPGGLVWEDANVTSFHIPPIEENPEPYLGHLMIVTRRHVDHLGDLTESEAESVARASRVLAAALREEGVERVHVAVIGLGVPHFHEHLYPRYPGVPAGTNWLSVDELPDAPHGGAEAIRLFVERLRSHL